MKHTKGPWAAKQVTSGSLKYWIVEEACYNGFTLASTASSEVSPDEANSRLMAAAPEVLLAAKHAIEFMRGMHGNDLQADEAPTGQAGPEYESIEAYHALMKAIAKAEGKE